MVSQGAPAISKPGPFEATTSGVRVLARPIYLAQQSRPELGTYLWSYRIRIENTRDDSVQVLARRWIIIDADGDRKVVEGEGVVGQQPTLAPGESYEYTSHVPLETQWGTMEGAYILRDSTRSRFEVRIPRFLLTPPTQRETTRDTTP